MRDFQDHSTVYERARQQVPLTADTIDRLEALYHDRRTEHYYGTTITTECQAGAMVEAATVLHDYIIQLEPDLTRYCNCEEQ